MALSTEIQMKTLQKTGEPKLLMVDWMDKWAKKKKGIINYGEAICNQPEDQKIMINPTTPMGHGNLLYAKLTYTMPKYWYNLEKVDEWIVASPSYPEVYGRIIAKKRELEGQIKAGLASAAQAVADFELLKHDERKYREILDYFKAGQKDEHILRALFVDRVDAHTGEGYSMISMTKRWPTIITDFLRMGTVEKKYRSLPGKVRDKLEISEAEATVLKTKDKLFEEWRTEFFPDIKDRYARVKNLVDARRKSIDEYREWLKPYVSNMKMMKEMSEVNPSELLTRAVSPWLKPNAWYSVRLWMWKMFTAEEVGKTGFVAGEIKPFDAFVKANAKKIEDHYEVKIVKKAEDKKKLLAEGYSEDEIIVVDEKLKEWNEPNFYESAPKISPDRYYYAFYDIYIESPLFKMEAGKEEIDDWNAMITPYLVSQNVILTMLLEVEAKKRWLNKYVKELIGVREVEDKIRKEVERKYGLEEEEDKKKEGFAIMRPYRWLQRQDKKVSSRWEKFKPKTRRVLRYFMRIGPYETVTNERLSKMYGRYMGGAMTDPLVKFLKESMGKLSGVSPP